MKKTLVLVLVLAMIGLSSAALAGEIIVVSREEGSGTRDAFIELVGIQETDAEGKKTDATTDEAMITNSTSVMMVTIAGNPDAIGYISMGSLNDTVKALDIDDAAPSVDNVRNGVYRIARPFIVVTGSALSDAAAEFLAFILSAEGQEVIAAGGYVAVDEHGAGFTGGKAEGKVVVAGSSSVTPVMEKLQEAFADYNPNIIVEVQQSDSSTGVNAVITGVCDLGMASRELKESEVEKDIEGIKIAVDGIAVIVNRDNPLASVSKQTVAAIFMGEISDWNDVGE